MLEDCGHIFEHSGLQNWLDQGANKIQFKTCPRCKTTVKKTQRYSDYVKRAIKDVILAKKMSFGDSEENAALQKKLLEDLNELHTKCPSLLIAGCKTIFETIHTLKASLKPERNDRRQVINKVELNAIQSKIQTVSHIINSFHDVKNFNIYTSSTVLAQVKVVLEVLLRYVDHITNQEIEDLKLEINRLRRIIQFETIEMSAEFKCMQTKPKVKELADYIRGELYSDKRYLDLLDNTVKLKLQSLAKEIQSAFIITDEERVEIVHAIGMSKGHWFKCPNGHPYAIGECGGAMEVAKCLCGARIGGRAHQLLATNRLAGEMDGATRQVYPYGAY